jgi:hypothetical protein
MRLSEMSFRDQEVLGLKGIIRGKEGEREQAGINLGDNENAGYTTNHPARNSLSLPQGRPIPSACIHVIKIKRALALSRDVKRANYKTPPPPPLKG